MGERFESYVQSMVSRRSDHPAGDGEAERDIQNMKYSLRCQLAQQGIEKTDWNNLRKMLHTPLKHLGIPIRGRLKDPKNHIILTRRTAI